MPKKLLLVRMTFMICLLFLSSGCARSLSMDPLHFWGNAHPKEDRVRKEAYIESHPELTEENKQKITRGEIWKGMTKDEAIASRGLPHGIWRNFSGDSKLEKWIYRYNYYFSENFLIFDRTSLVDWEDGWKSDK